MDEYTVTIGGIEHTLLLDADHAKRIGATKADTKAKTAQNKARTAANDK